MGQVKLDGCHWLKVGPSQRDEWGESLEKGVAAANNAGLVAINLADILGADPIYLLGFDMYGAGGVAAHWHDYYVGTSRQSPERHYENMLQDFHTRVPERVVRKVFNANQRSKLPLFEKISLSDLMDVVRELKRKRTT
jgi:hypothetical protein